MARYSLLSRRGCWSGSPARNTSQASSRSIVATAVAAVVGWNSILQVTSADQFFTDLPGKVFPISWQDFGSGVFALAAVALMLGFGPRRNDPARKVTTLAGLAGLGALIVDMYLY